MSTSRWPASNPPPASSSRPSRAESRGLLPALPAEEPPRRRHPLLERIEVGALAAHGNPTRRVYPGAMLALLLALAAASAPPDEALARELRAAIWKDLQL